VRLLQRIIRPHENDCTLLASVANIDEWLNEILADRPAAVVFEVLTTYLLEEEGKRLIQEVLKRFQAVGGELIFDCYRSVAIELQDLITPIKLTGVKLYWGIGDPNILETWCTGLKLIEDHQSNRIPGVVRFLSDSIVSRRQQEVGRMLRYKFQSY
jgi:O-methyltransferase involved in polyketide biosynthesis